MQEKSNCKKSKSNCKQTKSNFKQGSIRQNTQIAKKQIHFKQNGQIAIAKQNTVKNSEYWFFFYLKNRVNSVPFCAVILHFFLYWAQGWQNLSSTSIPVQKFCVSGLFLKPKQAASPQKHLMFLDCLPEIIFSCQSIFNELNYIYILPWSLCPFVNKHGTPASIWGKHVFGLFAFASQTY